jgi:hypothetical protein
VAVVNSLPQVSAETLLDLHVGYLKQVRRGHQKARARRYQRFKARLALLGVPPCAPLERALAMPLGGGGGGGLGVVDALEEGKVLAPSSRDFPL